MLNILRLLTCTSVTFILFLLFFSKAGITQSYPICYIVTSSGRVVDLKNICINRKQLDQNIPVDSADTGIRAVSPPDKPSNYNEQSVLPDGTKVHSNEIQERPDETEVFPDGTMIDPSGRQFVPSDYIGY